MTIDTIAPVSTPRGELGPAAEPVTLESLLRSLWRYRALAVALTMVFVAAAYGASLLVPEVFRSETRVFLTDPRYTSFNSDDARAQIDPAVYTVQQVRRVTADPVLRLASGKLEQQWTAQELKDRIGADPEEEALIIRLRADAGEADDAARMVTATAEAYREFNEETATVRLEAAMRELQTARQQLREAISANQKKLDADQTDPLLRARAATLNEQLIALDTTARGLTVDAASFGSGIDFIEPAEVPATALRPNPKANAALGGALGVVVAAATADALSKRRRRIVARTDAEVILSAPLLGEIPASALTSRSLRGSRRNVAGEAFRVVLASLEFALTQVGGNAVAISSIRPSQGKDLSVALLAVAAARDGKRVGVVDCDLHARGLTRLFNADDTAGVSDFAQGREDIGALLSESRSLLGSEVMVVPAGRDATFVAGPFQSERFGAMMTALSDELDLLLLDTPPLLQVVDSSIAAERTDGLVLLVTQGTLAADLERAAERLSFVSVPLLGYVYSEASRWPRVVRHIRT